ncbi:phosphatidylcholine and lysophosphatidylcholine phospholipase [Coemansia sp. RSA 532]|nr:phosphatidylcholine and lysophosphatidylcholine phospholipase [Coemansia sp. RSA 532]
MACVGSLIAAVIAARSTEVGVSTPVTQLQLEVQSQHGILVGLVYHIGAVLQTVGMILAIMLGFIVFEVVIPVATIAAHMILRATRTVGAAACLLCAVAVWGLYYFRYYYSAPKRRPRSLDGEVNDPFDLHPDVTRAEDYDGTNYMASLETRGNADAMGPAGLKSGAAGFPADFLNMFMKSISIFGYIEEAVFHEFSRQLQTRRLLAGEQMFDGEGDRDDLSFYVVIDGRVEIYLAGDQRAESEEMPVWSGSGTESDVELSEPEDNVGNDQPMPDSAILLNVVGPGDVLSSLFSILSLFTEGLPLHAGEHRHVSGTVGTSSPLRTSSPLGAYRFGDSNVSERHEDEARPQRPNVVARATVDTTLAVIPASAFQRVTRLYPTAAAHIMQVILTRLQRVTFATLYDYLDLPDELVAIERAIGELARRPLRAGIANNETFHQIRRVYGHCDSVVSREVRSPVLRVRRELPVSSRVSPAGTTPGVAATGTRLPASWKINRTNMEAINTGLHGDGEADRGLGVALNPGLRRGSIRQHRRTGSDMVAGVLPSEAEIDRLRHEVFQQICELLGINPYSDDGRFTPASPASTDSMHSSRRASMQRRAPRTEHLLPLLQTMGSTDQKRPATPLAHIPSLVNEIELYHVEDGYMLVEQGQRPSGLYVVLEGRVAITHRDAVGDFTGMERGGEPSDGVSEMTRRMTRLAQRRRGDAEAELAAAPEAKARRCTGRHPYYAHAGDVVGYLPALTDMAALYTARSSGSVTVGFVSRWALERIAERFPIALVVLARRLTSRLPAAVLDIDYALEWVQVHAGQMVYRRGEASDAVFVVLSGRLRAFVERSNGGVSIVAEYGQGQSVGEPSLLLAEPCRVNLHAIRDTELVRIPRALFRALMRAAPRLTFHLAQTLAVRTAQSLQAQQQQSQTMQTLQATVGAGLRAHNRNLKSVALIPVDAHVPVRAFAEQLEAALTGVAGRVALLDHTAMARVLGRHAFSRMARLKIAAWVAELEQRSRLLLHVADGGAASAWTQHCVRHSDFVLLVGLGAGDPRVGEYERLLLALKTTARKELVLLHEGRSCATGLTREWLKRRPWVHAHHHVQMPELRRLRLDTVPHTSGTFDGVFDGVFGSSGGVIDGARALLARSLLRPSQRMIQAHSGLDRIRTSLEKYYRRLTRSKQHTPTTFRGHRSDFARLARYLCGKSVGVVLSGGGARGIALLGVLQAFEEAGIPVDMIGGTSIGAFMSGLYARTADSVAIHGPLKAFARRMSSTWRFVLDITYPILAYTTGREFNRAIWKVFRDAEIEDLWLPFYCMTANITQSRSEVHTTGLLWRVVRASMSLGGFVPPLCDERGDLLVDGGYLDNLPVQVMKNELGAHMIFAVDIAGENDTSPVKYGASVSGFWVLLNHLNPFRSYWIPTLSEVQSRLTYASSDRALETAKIADCCVYLRVPPRDVGVLDFGRFSELYRRGYAYGRTWTSEWQRAGLLDRWQVDESVDQRDHSCDDINTPAGFKLARRNSI